MRKCSKTGKKLNFCQIGQMTTKLTAFEHISLGGVDCGHIQTAGIGLGPEKNKCSFTLKYFTCIIYGEKSLSF